MTNEDINDFVAQQMGRLRVWSHIDQCPKILVQLQTLHAYPYAQREGERHTPTPTLRHTHPHTHAPNVTAAYIKSPQLMSCICGASLKSGGASAGPAGGARQSGPTRLPHLPPAPPKWSDRQGLFICFLNQPFPLCLA
jgi:hypothetical protein